MALKRNDCKVLMLILVSATKKSEHDDFTFTACCAGKVRLLQDLFVHKFHVSWLEVSGKCNFKSRV